MTAGPAMPAPLPITTKMPVPMIAPTPIAVSWVALTAFLRPCPSSDVSVTSEWTSRTAKIPGRRPEVVAMLGPPFSAAAARVRHEGSGAGPRHPGSDRRRAGAQPDTDLAMATAPAGTQVERRNRRSHSPAARAYLLSG